MFLETDDAYCLVVDLVLAVEVEYVLEAVAQGVSKFALAVLGGVGVVLVVAVVVASPLVGES